MDHGFKIEIACVLFDYLNKISITLWSLGTGNQGEGEVIKQKSLELYMAFSTES